MRVYIQDPIYSTILFGCLIFLTFFFSRALKKERNIFPKSTTLELKGLAILMVIFSHIGYFLSFDNHFLFPLSIFGGVGVDIFLFLSGFGIAEKSSREITKVSIKKFYKKRLVRLFTPLWITLLIFMLLDYFLKNISYTHVFILKSFLGIFQTADIFKDFNSPLWYFTFILLYYLIFPWVFSKKHPWIGSVLLFILVSFIPQYLQYLFPNVEYFYNLHLLAFPLGVFLNTFIHSPIFSLVKKHMIVFVKIKHFKTIILTLLISIIIFGSYYAGNLNTFSKVTLSSVISISIILTGLIMKNRIKPLEIFGKYSFEIYLIHWPILYRYDFLYINLPAWLATILYLPLFLFAAFILNEISFLLRIFLNKYLYPKIKFVFPKTPKQT